MISIFLLAISIRVAGLLFQKIIHPQVDSDTQNIQTFTVARFLDTPIVTSHHASAIRDRSLRQNVRINWSF